MVFPSASFTVTLNGVAGNPVSAAPLGMPEIVSKAGIPSSATMLVLVWPAVITILGELVEIACPEALVPSYVVSVNTSVPAGTLGPAIVHGQLAPTTLSVTEVVNPAGGARLLTESRTITTDCTFAVT
jgi:hypothetical protein